MTSLYCYFLVLSLECIGYIIIVNIHFILVEPFVPENVGAAARAINTMGFNSLRLVKPCNYLADKAQMLAHGSVDILKKAQIFSSLKEALQDIDFIIGTTAKKRLAKADYYHCDEIADIIKRKSKSVNNTAIVFGRENKGLINTELRQCDILSYIPMKRSYPSLNLAQTVMLYAYSLSPLALGERKPPKKNTDPSQYRILKNTVIQLMKKTGVKMNIHNRIVERLGVLGDQDIHLLLSVCHMLSQEIETAHPCAFVKKLKGEYIN